MSPGLSQIPVILSEVASATQSKDPETFRFPKTVRTFLPTSLLALLLLFPAFAHAQGCAQCLDTTRATPPAVQAAYRHAILLLVGAASALFVAGVLFIRRNP